MPQLHDTPLSCNGGTRSGTACLSACFLEAGDSPFKILDLVGNFLTSATKFLLVAASLVLFVTSFLSTDFLLTAAAFINYAYCPTPSQQYFPTSGALVFIFNQFKACLSCMIPLFLAMGAQGRVPLVCPPVFLRREIPLSRFLISLVIF